MVCWSNLFVLVCLRLVSLPSLHALSFLKTLYAKIVVSKTTIHKTIQPIPTSLSPSVCEELQKTILTMIITMVFTFCFMTLCILLPELYLATFCKMCNNVICSNFLFHVIMYITSWIIPVENIQEDVISLIYQDWIIILNETIMPIGQHHLLSTFLQNLQCTTPHSFHMGYEYFHFVSITCRKIHTTPIFLILAKIFNSLFLIHYTCDIGKNSKMVYWIVYLLEYSFIWFMKLWLKLLPFWRHSFVCIIHYIKYASILKIEMILSPYWQLRFVLFFLFRFLHLYCFFCHFFWHDKAHFGENMNNNYATLKTSKYIIFPLPVTLCSHKPYPSLTIPQTKSMLFLNIKTLDFPKITKNIQPILTNKMTMNIDSIKATIGMDQCLPQTLLIFTTRVIILHPICHIAGFLNEKNSGNRQPKPGKSQEQLPFSGYGSFTAAKLTSQVAFPGQKKPLTKINHSCLYKTVTFFIPPFLTRFSHQILHIAYYIISSPILYFYNHSYSYVYYQTPYILNNNLYYLSIRHCGSRPETASTKKMMEGVERWKLSFQKQVRIGGNTSNILSLPQIIISYIFQSHQKIILARYGSSKVTLINISTFYWTWKIKKHHCVPGAKPCKDVCQGRKMFANAKSSDFYGCPGKNSDTGLPEFKLKLLKMSYSNNSNKKGELVMGKSPGLFPWRTLDIDFTSYRRNWSILTMRSLELDGLVGKVRASGTKDGEDHSLDWQVGGVALNVPQVFSVRQPARGARVAGRAGGSLGRQWGVAMEARAEGGASGGSGAQEGGMSGAQEVGPESQVAEEKGSKGSCLIFTRRPQSCGSKTPLARRVPGYSLTQEIKNQNISFIHSASRLQIELVHRRLKSGLSVNSFNSLFQNSASSECLLILSSFLFLSWRLHISYFLNSFPVVGSSFYLISLNYMLFSLIDVFISLVWSYFFKQSTVNSLGLRAALGALWRWGVPQAEVANREGRKGE
ncbi:putative signal peptide protein [Puccinia sorghi]|uniref:Putative signal peptide protein n=1 Tax=Puccinia sorghi TaxID=27349 RepID=A0A0L6V748_9BASI|nr:putative signal peptide protein [Puccinia sorghi]